MESCRMKKTEDIHFLKEGDNRVTGTAAYNRLLNLITRMSSETIDIGRNNAGGLRLEVIGIYGNGSSEGSLSFSFKASVSGNTLTISEGRVHLPSGTLQATQASFQVDSTQMCYYVECASSSASIARASYFPNILDASSGKMFLPLLVASTAGIVYRHIGDYSFDWLPYFWMSGYDSTKAQALMHSASGAPAWIDTGVCS